MVAYDNHHFMASECEVTYFEDLMRKKLLLEKRISLQNMLEKLPAFYES